MKKVRALKEILGQRIGDVFEEGILRHSYTEFGITLLFASKYIEWVEEEKSLEEEYFEYLIWMKNARKQHSECLAQIANDHFKKKFDAASKEHMSMMDCDFTKLGLVHKAMFGEEK